ncbi:MAG: winged helix-turn-helix domain-containing protein [Rickettsiales bacterium]|nr:winged helix-turn-helix domain-containing protein [Rickettsiales bacterium]
MQTSSLTPVTLYSTQKSKAQHLLPLLPEGSIEVGHYAEIAANRRSLLITHDQSSARDANKWVNEQPPHRHAQIFLLLPEGESRLTPVCAYRHQPTHLNQILQFLNSSRALPALPETLKLTEIETSLIEQLHIADAAVSHEILMQNVWGHQTELDTHTLETHLYRLRKKLDETELQIATEDSSYQLLSSPK